MLRIVSLVLFYLLATACSDGRLENERNRYLSVFGIDPLDSPSQFCGLIGRVVDNQGSPVVGAKVYLDATPFGLTNKKGGFYLPTLTSDNKSVIIMAEDGLAKYIKLDITLGNLLELDKIELDTPVLLSGKVQYPGETNLEGILVTLPGTPFQILTKEDGYFDLSLPPATYRLKVVPRTLNYKTMEIPDLEITEDKYLEFALEEYPYPNGEISVVSKDGFIVRGLETTLKIKTVPGVKLMLITPDNPVAKQSQNLFHRWMPLAEEIKIKHNSEGFTGLTFKFQDALGKESLPLNIHYLNVKLDESWKIYFGEIKAPLTIPKNSKAAFLTIMEPTIESVDSATAVTAVVEHQTTTHNDEVSSREDATLSSEAGTMIEKNIKYSEDDAKHYNLYSKPQFFADVSVEKGATILGGGDFYQKLEVKGTKENPISWNGQNMSSYLNGSLGHFKYVEAKDLDIEKRSAYVKSKLIIEDSKFSKSQINTSFESEMQLDLTIESSILTDTSLWFYGNSKFLSNNPSYLNFTMKKSEFYRSEMSFEFTDTSNSAGSASTTEDQHFIVHLIENNFLDTDSLRPYYIKNDLAKLVHQEPSTIPDSGSSGTVESNSGLIFTIEGKGNYFKFPEKLYPGIDITKWPSFIDPTLPTPLVDVGPN